MSALLAASVTKRYGHVAALDAVDLSVAPGELVGLIGANGAGKSTLMKIACGLVNPTSGRVEVCGVPPYSREARRRLGYLAELFRFPGWCTADEVLALHQHLAGSKHGASEREALVGLGDVADRRVERMSKGMQQRLGIAQALVGEPSLLLLDEPTSALDPSGRRAVRDLLEELRTRGLGVLLNSHLLGDLELVCDRVAILAAGRVVADAPPEQLTRRGGVEIETQAGVQTFPDAQREDIPGIVAQLVSEGASVYEVRMLRSTLEDAYLKAVQVP